MSRPFSARSHWGIWLFLLLVVGLIALTAVGAVAVYEFRYADRVYEGVRVAGIPLGGLTLEEATTAIHDGLTPYPGPPITLRYGDRSWILTPAELGVTVDARATAAEAYAVGRSGKPTIPHWESLRVDLITQWNALWYGHVIVPALHYDESNLAYILKVIAREVDLPPHEGKLTIVGLDVSGTPGQPGRRVNLDATRAALTSLLRAGEGGAVSLVVEERQPVVNSVDKAVALATALLGKPLTLIVESVEGVQRFAVDRATLRQWLAFSPTPIQGGEVELAVQLDRKPVVSYLQDIAAQLDRPARDAKLDFNPDTQQVLVLSPSQVGQKLDVEAGADAIEAALLDGDPEREITLPVALLQPKVDSNKIAEMGIVELVSEGTTYFKGSSRDRVHNIVTAAERFRGVVIPPDGEFSFDKYVGAITAADGFVEGYIIGAERTAVGIGGGVCQVSTTAFRAAFFGGFPITERWAHGYVVSWYGEPGLDATIYTPNVDFRFRNDTGHYLLIKPEVDTAQGRITFYFYGTRPDRTVEMQGPEISNIRKPEKPLYQEDSSLAKGVIKQVDWAKDGEDVVVKRIIHYGDGTTSEQEFTSHYQPWRAVFLYGPGTQLPPDALSEPTATP